jgi:hypothetical protein
MKKKMANNENHDVAALIGDTSTTTLATQKYNDADKEERIRLKDLFGEDTDDENDQSTEPNNSQPLIPMANHVRNVPENTQQVIGHISNNDISTTTSETIKKTNTTKERRKKTPTLNSKKKFRFTNFFKYHNTNDNNNHN